MKTLVISERTNVVSLFRFLVLSSVLFAAAVTAYGQCSPVVISPSTLPDGFIYTYYSQTFTATGGYYPPFTFTVTSGSLPPGFNLDSMTGVLSGTCYSAGIFNFTITATDYFPCSGSQAYTLKILDPCSGLTISPPTLPDALLGVEYSQQLTASGGVPPYSFSTGDVGMPPGLNFDYSGLIYGIPEAKGEFSIYVSVYDSSPYYCSTSKNYILSVRSECQTITIYPRTMPAPVLNEPFYQQLTCTGGSSPYSFSVTGGAIPPGLTFSADGVLSGTPTTSGSYTLLVAATDSNGCKGHMSYTFDIGCTSGTGSLSGYIAISGDSGATLYTLNGSGVSGTVTANGSGGRFTSGLVNGSFSFGEVPAGTYAITASVDYTDNVTYDADRLSYGCPAPSGKKLFKNFSPAPVNIEVACDSVNMAAILVPPPLFMLHGSFDCYEKWFSADAGDPYNSLYFDNHARSLGMISFTPNYNWWDGSWTLRAGEVLDQIGQDLASLTTGGIPPYAIVAHDMGGLAVRVLGSSLYSDLPLIKKLKKAYLLGTPNSGADYSPLLGRSALLGPASVIRYFNEVYPDFGSINVCSIAGNKGWWNTLNNDGFVSTGSVFNIRRVACSDGDCIVYPAVKLEDRNSRKFYFRHNELGSPESTADIFGVFLPSSERSVPEAPVGGVGWGTVGHTSTVVTTGAGSNLCESEANYPFTVAKCDGIAIHITVSAGSALFRVSDPSGLVYDFANNWFVRTAPQPGTWHLKVTPGGSGVSFESSVIENSIFGISAYLTSEYLPASGKTTLVMEKKGDWSLAVLGNATASLYDGSGNFLATYVLASDGDRYYAEITAPQEAGSYQFIVKAEGSYSGSAFTRVEFERLTVLGDDELFTGAFTDTPADTNGDGKYDSVRFVAGVKLKGAGAYVVSADLFDSDDNFLSHSASVMEAQGAGSKEAELLFALSDVTCSQLESHLTVSGVKILDPATLAPLDVWSSPVPTGTYSPGQFKCAAGSPAPSVAAATPQKITAGTTVNMVVTGKNFSNGSTISFESGVGSQITILQQKVYDNRVIFASISCPAAATGQAYLVVKNPDGKSGTLEEPFFSVPDEPPSVYIEEPANGSVCGGNVPVTANAFDDVKVESVSFELDGSPQATVTSFPFIWPWDTLKSATGVHNLTAKATDSEGKTAVSTAQVTVVRAPSVSSINKRTDPFRFVLNGSNFQQEAVVYVNGGLWPNIRWKSPGRIVVKGGSSLKSAAPKGSDVNIRIVNPDGGEAAVVWRW